MRRLTVALTTLAAALIGVSSPANASGINGVNLTDYQWHLASVGAQKAWQVTRGNGVTVAVIDSGVDPSHPDLAPNLLSEAGIGFAFKYHNIPVNDMYDLVGHGTHVAGIIAGAGQDGGISGIAPESKIYPIKLLSDISSEEDFNVRERIAESLRDAAAHGARVVNMSFGANYAGTGDITENHVCQGIADVADLDLVLVAAAGNDGAWENLPSIPANCPGVITVGAVDASDNPAYFSSVNDRIDISAPGEHVLSSGNQEASSYLYESGTSMAAPIVAGVAALVRAAHPDWNAQQVEDHLKATARDVYAPGFDSVTGAGVVDAAAALGLEPTATSGLPSLSVRASRDGIRWRPVNLETTGYEVNVLNRQGEVVYQETLPANAAFFPSPEGHDTPGNWVLLKANLADGRSISEISSPWGAAEEAAVDLSATNVGFTIGPNRLMRLEWDNTPGTRAYAVGLLKNDRLIDMYSTSTELGPLPSHYLAREQYDPNADYTIYIASVGLTPGISESTKEIAAKSPVYWQKTPIGGLVRVDARVASSTAKKAINPEVKGTALTVVITSDNGKKRTAVVKAKPLADGSYFLTIPARATDRISIGGQSVKVSKIPAS